MKETKVCMELPEDCKDCPCCSCELKPEFIKIGDFMYCNLLKQKFRYKEERKKLKDCPLIDIKTHDRELVKEVCEKAKSLIIKYDLLKDYQGCAGYFMLDKIIDQIQKEFEK